MKIQDLQQVVQDEPLFESSLLLAGDQDPRDLYRQLSRWAEAGKIVQLRRGLCALGAPRLAELDWDLLKDFAQRTKKAKLIRAFAHLEELRIADQAWGGRPWIRNPGAKLFAKGSEPPTSRESRLTLVLS